MASNSRPRRSLTPRADAMPNYMVAEARQLARHVIKVSRDGSYVTLWLATNPGFTPQHIDWEQGLLWADEGGGDWAPDEMDEELQMAELAMAYAAQAAAVPSNLKAWADQLAARFGSNRQAAHKLVDMEPDLDRKNTELRNMIRKLEEWRQGKYRSPSGRNARRVARLNLVEASTVTLGVTGIWLYLDGGGDTEAVVKRRFNTDTAKSQEESYQGAHLLAAEGEGFIGLVEESARNQVLGYGVQLNYAMAMHVDIEFTPGKRTRKREAKQ